MTGKRVRMRLVRMPSGSLISERTSETWVPMHFHEGTSEILHEEACRLAEARKYVRRLEHWLRAASVVLSAGKKSKRLGRQIAHLLGDTP